MLAVFVLFFSVKVCEEGLKLSPDRRSCDGKQVTKNIRSHKMHHMHMVELYHFNCNPVAVPPLNERVRAALLDTEPIFEPIHLEIVKVRV